MTVWNSDSRRRMPAGGLASSEAGLFSHLANIRIRQMQQSYRIYFLMNNFDLLRREEINGIF